MPFIEHVCNKKKEDTLPHSQFSKMMEGADWSDGGEGTGMRESLEHWNSLEEGDLLAVLKWSRIAVARVVMTLGCSEREAVQDPPSPLPSSHLLYILTSESGPTFL